MVVFFLFLALVSEPIKLNKNDFYQSTHDNYIKKEKFDENYYFYRQSLSIKLPIQIAPGITVFRVSKPVKVISLMFMPSVINSVRR